MGTEVQSKMYIPGYYSMRDVNDDTSNNSWSLHHENKALTNGQYYDLFLGRQNVEGYLGLEKEQLRQTILRHESIFRHQLRELHRLYKRQRDLMNEIKSKDLLKHLISTGSSQSSLFSSHITSDDAKKTWHISDSSMVDSTCARPSMSCFDIIQSPYSFVKGKIMAANGVHTQNGVNLKDSEILESHGKKLHKRLIDLELPADDYISNEDVQLEEKASELSRLESYSHNRNFKVTCDSNLKLYVAGDMSSDCNGEVSRSHLYSRETHGLTDLNKPIQVEEASTSASVDIIGDITCSKDEVRRQDLSVNSHSDTQCFSKEFSQNPHRESNESICLKNLYSESEGYQSLSHKFEAGLIRSGRKSCHGGSCADDLPAPSDSSQVEAREVFKPKNFLQTGQKKTEERRKRTIFGVEIFERNPDVSVSASHGSCMHPPVAQSVVLHSESSSVSSWSKLPSCLNQSLISIHEDSCSNRSHVTSNSRLNPSFRAEVSYQNSLCLSSQLEARESQNCCQSNASNYPNGFSNNHTYSEQVVKLGPMKFFKGMSMDVKPTKGLGTDLLLPIDFHKEVISQQNAVPVFSREPSISQLDEQRQAENSSGGLPWLKAKPLSSGESSKGKEASYQMNLDFLQTCSQTFSNKLEICKGPPQTSILNSRSETCDCDEPKGIKGADCHSTRKILGIPIFCEPDSCKDLPSPNSPSKTCVVSVVDGENTRKFGSLNSALGCDSSKSQELLQAEGIFVRKGLVDQTAESRHHIDLNLCVVEEDPPSTLSSPRTKMKIAADIDLEAPVAIEVENIVSPRGDSSENQLKRPSEWLKDVPGELPDDFVRVAVEAIIALSLSPVHGTEKVATSETSMKGSLYRLADVIMLCRGDPEGVGAVASGEDGASSEDSILDGLDYFELMTLRLTETKVEECRWEPPPEVAVEDQKDEEKMARRPRKGQARRGRQRKDFQRDILPSLASLSRYEITEDIHTIEELFKATGSNWQSNLAQRGAKSGRGRRRLRGCTPSPSPNVTTVCPPPIQQQQQQQLQQPQPNIRELGLEERSLTGWGKRTRRPPRQRYPNTNPLLALK